MTPRPRPFVVLQRASKGRQTLMVIMWGLSYYMDDFVNLFWLSTRSTVLPPPFPIPPPLPPPPPLTLPLTLPPIHPSPHLPPHLHLSIPVAVFILLHASTPPPLPFTPGLLRSPISTLPWASSSPVCWATQSCTSTCSSSLPRQIMSKTAHKWAATTHPRAPTSSP